jgi:hypothetical protein
LRASGIRLVPVEKKSNPLGLSSKTVKDSKHKENSNIAIPFMTDLLFQSINGKRYTL